MQCELIDGELHIVTTTETESYAVGSWIEIHSLEDNVKFEQQKRVVRPFEPFGQNNRKDFESLLQVDKAVE